jgi:RNA polymerase sigma-70 factor (ECF subfamily)
MPSASMNRVIHFLRRAVAPPGGDDDRELLRRFVAAGEEAAFAGLVRRHGPMVLGVCRRVLDDLHDAEDAFQATFLVLAQKAGSVRKQDSLASWLYGVAFRVARKARAAAALRRRVEERPVEHVSPPDPATEAAWRELRPVIDEELSRLPEKYRAPLVLCYLEGKTNDEAARLLGWTKGTVSGRLARARDLLRPRLARRGLALPAGVLAALLADNEAAPAAALVGTTVKAVLAGGASAPAAALARGVIRAMFATQAMKWTAVVTVLGLATAGTLWHYAPAAGGTDEEARRAAADEKAPAKAKPGVLFTLPEEPKKDSDDLAKLQGIWQAVALEHNGQVLSAEAVKAFKVAIDKDRITFHSSAADSVSTFQLQPSSKPKVIWLEHVGADRKVEKVRGIYALEDGRLKICVDNDTGKAEPTEFATRPGSGLTLMVLERESDGRVIRAQAAEDRARYTLTTSGSPMRAVAFSPDGKSVWACPEDGRVGLWDVATGKVRASLAADGNTCLAMAVSPDGKRVLLGGAIDAVKGKGGDEKKVAAGWLAIYSADLGKAVWHQTDISAVRAVAFSPDGKRAAAASADGRVRVIDVETGKVLLAPWYGHDGEATAVAFSPDGKVLATAGADKLVALWDLVTGKALSSFAGHTGKATAVRFSPDGRLLLTAGQDGTVRLWGVIAGKELRALHASKKGVLSAVFSPDGTLIATAAEDGPAKLWELDTGKELASYGGHAKAVNGVAFSPDGKTLATAGADGTVKLWDVAKAPGVKTPGY